MSKFFFVKTQLTDSLFLPYGKSDFYEGNKILFHCVLTKKYQGMFCLLAVALVYGKKVYDDYDYKQTTLPLVVSLPRSTRRGPWRGFLLNWSLFHSLAWVVLLCSSPLGISCVRRSSRTEGGVLEGRSSSSWGLLPATWHTPYSTNISLRCHDLEDLLL